MRYQIALARSEPIHTAVIRGRVRPQELAQFVPAACGEVWSFVRSANLPRPGRHLPLYLDEHDPVYVQAARALAERVFREEPAQLDKRIVHAFRHTLGRAPLWDELVVLQNIAGHFTMPGWSKDGKRLAFDLREGDKREIWAVDVSVVEGGFKAKTR